MFILFPSATKHLNEMLLKDDIPKSVVNNVKISGNNIL